MKTVFLDTNVVLDVLLQNEGFWQDAYRIFKLAECGDIIAYISASSMTDIFYVARKKLSAPVARSAIESLLNLLLIVGVESTDIHGALTISILDFEDALQVWCAKKAGVDALVTRDIKDFRNADINVITPVQLLNLK